ncbi:MAG: hypothetical protein IBX55_23635 [Methyloprofundus sp.]|nr:hypothetical protein [Methyloprofundus sp.]
MPTETLANAQNTARTSFVIAFDEELNFSDPALRDCMVRVLPSMFVAVDASDDSFVCCNMTVGYHPEIDSFVCDIDHDGGIAVRLKMEFDDNLLQDDDELLACAEWIAPLLGEDTNLVATLPVDSVLFMLEMSSWAGMIVDDCLIISCVACEFEIDDILSFSEAEPSDYVFEHDNLIITVADVLQASKTNDDGKTIWRVGNYEISFFNKDWR